MSQNLKSYKVIFISIDLIVDQINLKHIIRMDLHHCDYQDLSGRASGKLDNCLMCLWQEILTVIKRGQFVGMIDNTDCDFDCLVLLIQFNEKINMEWMYWEKLIGNNTVQWMDHKLYRSIQVMIIL